MISYVLPIRCEACAPAAHAELLDYLETIGEVASVIVADGSPPAVVEMHERRFGPVGAHVPVVPTSLNGKVDGVHAGVSRADTERVIVADDDVRYSVEALRAVAQALDGCDLVIPQNVFPRDAPWHARWDTARTLLNRALDTDYPGTLAVRRSAFAAAGGYDGDVLFENLELIRTIEAAGGIVDRRPDLFVLRLPPSADRFVEQRVRQAYDDLARPTRLAAALATLPLVAFAISRRRYVPLLIAAMGSIGLAELGRRKDGGADRFPASASLFAPLWILERGGCAWLAVASRLVFGGCVYRGRVIRRPATSRRELRRRRRAPHRASRRTTASSATGHTGTAARPLAAG